jgi:hypothetical protein
MNIMLADLIHNTIRIYRTLTRHNVHNRHTLRTCLIRLTEVWDITFKMLGYGHKGGPTFKAKAAETAGVLPFIVQLLERTMDKFRDLGGDRFLKAQLLLASGKAMLDFEQTLLAFGRNIDRAGQRSALSQWQLHVHLFQRAGGTTKPKHHTICHMIRGMSFLGNARYYMTYKDESMNRTIARIAQSCHRLTFYSVIHVKCSYIKFVD